MAQLSYGPVSLEVVLTRTLDERPIPTRDGLDTVWAEVTLSVECLWNPYATASRNSQPVLVAGGAAPPAGPGDRLGVSLVNLKSILETPRLRLVYTVGADVVYSVPASGMQCDPAGGPKPLGCRVLQVLGDKSAIVEVGFKFVVPFGKNALLANRFSTTHDTDRQGLTAISYDGQAEFSLDVLNVQAEEADGFRWMLIPPCPSGFQREALKVTLSSDGRRLNYLVVDRQRVLNLGSGSPAVEVESYATVGSDSPIKSIGDMGRVARQVLADLSLNPMTGFGMLPASFRLAENTLPTLRASSITKVTGRGDVDRNQLANIAIVAGLSRFRAAFGGVVGGGNGVIDAIKAGVGLSITGAGLVPVSAYMTQAVHARWCEFRVEGFQSISAVLTAAQDPLAFNKLMDLTNSPVPLSRDGSLAAATYNTGSNPSLPNSDNTRGLYTGTLLAAVLGIPGDVPEAPALPGTYSDLEPG